MKTLYCLTGFFLAVILPISALKHSLTCQDGDAHLRCNAGSVIFVTTASYGRTDRTTCPSHYILTTSCSAHNSLIKVKKSCDGKPFCLVPASNSIFGDPCVGTSKYLRVSYNCISTNPILLTTHVCEWGRGRISCPGGHTINVRDAFYGRDDGTTCGGPAKTTSCRSPSSTGRIRLACQGRQACDLTANFKLYGPDPCFGTLKYVKIVYSCISS